MAEDFEDGPGEVLKSFHTPMHGIEVRENALILARKIPPKKKQINYKDIASVEHTRLIDYGRLLGPLVAAILIYIINFVGIAKDILAQLVLEINHATGNVTSSTIDQSIRFQAEQATILLSALFTIIAGYYILRFIFSLRQRFIIYRQGKNPIAIPFPLTGESLDVMKKLNEKVKEAKGISKEEAEKIVGKQIRDMLSERKQMQEDLMGSVKVAAMAAKTEEQKAKVKRMLDESIAKLEAQDEQINRELKKTGLKKEDVFKKYRIKAPKEEFIDSILGEGGIGETLNKNSEEGKEEPKK